jgi:broad specificity phosphatase PhoE
MARFEAAIRALAAEAPHESAAVVTHGTVLSLLVAKHNGLQAFAFWDALTLPSYVVLDPEHFTIDGPVRSFPA